jgi:hypothetical protein
VRDICGLEKEFENTKGVINLFDFLVLSATFSNISAISRRPVVVVEEVGENHRPWTSNW